MFNLAAYEPQPDDRLMISRYADGQIDVLILNKNIIMILDLGKAKEFFESKNTGNADEAKWNDKIAYYKESDTPEDMIAKTLEYLNKIPVYPIVLNFTEKEILQKSKIRPTKNSFWMKEYQDCSMGGNGEGFYYIIPK